jgi:His/Glu/Gln/Arg/opine family amino acid ABC transporter permease subunit
MNAFFHVYGEYLPEWWPRLMEAARVTAELSSLGFVLALVLASLLVAMVRSRYAALRQAANAFIQFVRAVPLLALLLALYFGCPRSVSRSRATGRASSVSACRVRLTWPRCFAAG